MQAHLEKQVKELNVRIVDLETKSLANASRPATISRRADPRIEELTSQLSGKAGNQRTVRDAKHAVAEVERQRAKFEEERRAYEAKLEELRRRTDKLHTQENELQSAKRRAERDAADYKQKALNLERDNERLRNRLAIDRPSSAYGSPHTSPRK
ncbi:hypothetical protein K525DRAFT_240837 [Schizophyllum commune Loenen D]|nr:hypothetical protein K525DRAFT_240837 [Schizophyllum commune Loenen D]